MLVADELDGEVIVFEVEQDIVARMPALAATTVKFLTCIESVCTDQTVHDARRIGGVGILVRSAAQDTPAILVKTACRRPWPSRFAD
ncbi:MAG TPA: hypothetical protein PLC22_18785 [Gordonia sp. (in: high G+C Gram-positive bacteria)]|nr:hypothetical protein [Gordonia sp. (in: high G+C Gram-positive bacteria)]